MDNALTVPLAVRINKLFDVMHQAGAPADTNAAVAEAITRQGDANITADEIRGLRDGTAAVFAEGQLSAIAEYFGVPARYLTDPAGDASVDAQLGLLRVLRDSGVRGIHTCGRPLSPQTATDLVERTSRRD
ncbi:XRE family transcriptional regulator [Mycobacterium sp.]|uniref:XRE family transcriptional regulator n=1 Tax=Mycobacterium sp. TaxID=1785 RepID=UPI0025E370BA|nr:XRE family transcriptional regulator [Mycobacterium sp.]